jgi:DNA-binding response OmpR family regulator
LLVEDNELNRDMLTRRLQRRGFEIMTAVTGEEGVHLAAAKRPDIVLMDISLPGMDGWEAGKQIKEAAATAGIPVIALTAHALSTDREHAAEIGFDDYATKPVEFESLLDKMKALLNRGERR